MVWKSYHRNLSHVFPQNVPIFFTWRLHGSLPAAVAPDRRAKPETHGGKFCRMDRHLDRATSGPMWLKDQAIAGMVASRTELGADRFKYYELHEYVVMPNHVHVLLAPYVHPAVLMRLMKGVTARRANQMLHRSGQPFWQDESFDHWCRSVAELRKLREYIVMNPVKAGLASRPQDYPWCSSHQRLLKKHAKLVQRGVVGKT
jgi:putative transposase